MIYLEDEKGLNWEIRAEDFDATVSKHKIDLTKSTARVRVKIPASKYLELVEAVGDIGGKIL